MLKRIDEYLAGRWRFTKDWLRRGKPLWLWLARFVALIALPFLVLNDEAQFRWAGMFLQFAGLYAVVRGLNETRKLFNRPPVWLDAWRWITHARYIIVPPPPVTGTMNVT